MTLSAPQAKYFSHWLTRSLPSDNLGKLTASLQDAQVDLTPHQIDAVLFAFKSPLSKGTILADEVGLGKTIEAGIILYQFWAEHRRDLLIIPPANLRKQWATELQEKFYLPSRILESKTFNGYIKQGNLNPFNCEEIVICSYQFAKTKAPYLRQTPWDLVVIDEAHRLRNVYKPTNKISSVIKNALADQITAQRSEITTANSVRNNNFFEEEMEKLDNCAEDVKAGLEKELRDLDAEIKLRKSESKKTSRLEEKVRLQHLIKDLEKKRSEKRLNLYQAQDEVDSRKETLLEKVEAMLAQKIEQSKLLTFHWKTV